MQIHAIELIKIRTYGEIVRTWNIKYIIPIVIMVNIVGKKYKKFPAFSCFNKTTSLYL